MKKSAKVLEVIGVVVLAVVISITGFMLIGPLFGWEAHKVLTGSMEPTFEVGGMIITKPVKLEDIKPGDHEERTGDIIAFRLKRGEEEEQITHRVVDVVVLEGKLWFQTWGPLWSATNLTLGVGAQNRSGFVVGDGAIQDYAGIVATGGDVEHQKVGHVMANAVGGGQGAPFFNLEIDP